MSGLNCKKCQSAHYVKNGYTRSVQRYKCRDCGCQFTNTQRRGVHPALKSLALVLYAYCGVSMRKIGRLCQVSTVSVLKWVRQAALNIETDNHDASSDIVMIDELWHFVNGKKTKYGYGAPLTGYRVTLLDGSWVIVALPAFKS